MRIGIVYKKEKVKNKSVVPELIKRFQARGCNVKIIHSGAELKDVDYAVVLGGDGALLHAAVIAGMQGIKTVGINYGTLGFLSEFEQPETFEVVNLICGSHVVLKRTVLKITLNGKIFYALNEAVVQRDYARPYGNQVASFGIKINGEKIQDYVADGLIISTPTGSTAYSLSAGGCILAPDAKVFGVVPICPMGLRAVPFVVSDEGKFTFDLSREEEDLKLYADGRPIGTLSKDSDFLVEKANFTADFITADVNKLFHSVNRKFVK